jgi:hypothetical protein
MKAAVRAMQMQTVGDFQTAIGQIQDEEAEVDVVKSYQLQANCYLTKPVQKEAFESLVKSINDFWLTEVKLPRQELSG